MRKFEAPRVPREILVNSRVLNLPTTGVQRYVLEMLRRLGPQAREIRPPQTTSGARGHLWEQSILPCLVGRNVLWSPANTGPLAVSRQVVTIHDTVPLDHPEWLNPRFAAVHRWLIPRIARRAAHIITVSGFTRDSIAKSTGVPMSKISVIHNGVDSKFEPKPECEIVRSRRALDLAPGRYILALGSIEPRKNLPRLLQGWNQALPHIPDDTWLVIAGAPGRSLVYHEVPLGGIPERVRFTGYVPDEYLPGLYSGATAFAYMSVYEGFGLPPLEAMACGTPVLTGNKTSLLEVVGDDGLTVDPFDVTAIGDAIRRLVLDAALRHRLSERGRRRSRQFSWQRASEQTLELLLRLAG